MQTTLLLMMITMNYIVQEDWKEKKERAAGDSEKASLCSGSGLGGGLDELERTAGLLTPRIWLICRAGAARRQSQIEALTNFHEPSKTGRRGRQDRGYPGGWGDGVSKDGRS